MQRFGVGEPGFLFRIFDDVVIAAGEFFDDRQVFGGVWLFAVRVGGFIGGVVQFDFNLQFYFNYIINADTLL